MYKTLLPKVINGLWFQVVWFICVLFKQDGVLVTGLLLLVALIFMRLNTRILLAAALVTAGGCMIDTLLTQLGLFKFDESTCRSCIPLWLILLWGAFSLTLFSSLSYLQHRPAIAALAGAIAAPMSYFAAFKLGAVSFHYDATVTMGIISAIWIVFLPCCGQLIWRLTTKKEFQSVKNST